MSRERLHPVMPETEKKILSDMMVIEIIHQYRQTDQIFKRLEQHTGSCVCCQGLFISLAEAAKQFGFDLDRVMAEIEGMIQERGK